MPTKPLSDDLCQQAVNAYAACDGNKLRAAERLGMPYKTFASRLQIAKGRGFTPGKPSFEVEDLPDGDEPIEDLLERRSRAFLRKDQAERARKLIDVRIKLDGPIGILHMGDPHVDDDGCDLPTLRRHVEIINSTPGMFGANVGDLQNNWVGRLAHLWGQQETSKRTAWRLTEWLVRSVPWLYLIGGNHDAWSGSGDPLQWITRDQAGVFDYHGVRLNLRFPNDKTVRVNARHDFRGHSMWNTVHGPMKAAKMGWRDHILTCGHLHTSGYGFDRDPSTGLISHAIRLAGYKRHDNYAKEGGLPDQNVAPAAVTIIRPDREDDDIGLVTVIHDVELAAQTLTMLRRDYDKPKKRAA
jgi:hypothetical protein